MIPTLQSMVGSRRSNLSLGLSISLLCTPPSQLQFPHVVTSQELQICLTIFKDSGKSFCFLKVSGEI